MKKLTIAISLPFFVLLINAPQAAAQRATASVAGDVLDPSRAPVPGARVVIRNLSTGVERTAVSNDAGYYAISALPAGRYSITVSHEGFSTFGVQELVLQVDQQAALNVDLQIGQVTETVSVTGSVAAVESRGATLNTFIHQKMITDLPLNGRNVLQLLRVTPGTLVAPGTWGQAATRPEAGNELISASGGRGNSTTFVLDGGIHEDPYTEV